MRWTLSLLLLSPTVAGAAERTASSTLIDGLRHCLTITEPAPRLACLDLAAQRLTDAETARDIAVLDRADIRRTRRSLFGLSANSGEILADRLPAEPIERLDTHVAGAVRIPGDRWTLTLAEGGRWQTTEPWSVGPEPRAGTAIAIRRAALGSYVLKSPGTRAVRVRRVD